MASCPKCGTPTTADRAGIKGCKRHGNLLPQFWKPGARPQPSQIEVKR